MAISSGPISNYGVCGKKKWDFGNSAIYFGAKTFRRIFENSTLWLDRKLRKFAKRICRIFIVVIDSGPMLFSPHSFYSLFFFVDYNSDGASVYVQKKKFTEFSSTQ